MKEGFRVVIQHDTVEQNADADLLFLINGCFFRFRIGIHTSEVLVGNIGCNYRINYSCLGHGVNIANRLEGLNKVILIRRRRSCFFPCISITELLIWSQQTNFAGYFLYLFSKSLLDRVYKNTKMGSCRMT